MTATKKTAGASRGGRALGGKTPSKPKSNQGPGKRKVPTAKKAGAARGAGGRGGGSSIRRKR
jgi:hypothetical protein